jgi:hypothetical protein
VLEYRQHALKSLEQFQHLLQTPAWAQLSSQDQESVLIPVLRLYSPRGMQRWGSEELNTAVKATIPSTVNEQLAVLTLQRTLRSLFAPHPMLSTTSSRALSRPADGDTSRADLHDDAAQRFKKAEGWGCPGLLEWCCEQVDVEKHIGVILPPTLVMMDDFEPMWRGIGINILDSWIGKLSSEVMKRMGLDKLLLDSLIHTMSLNCNPPLENVLKVALDLVDRTTTGERKASRLGEIMDRGVITCWAYAPSGLEGRVVLTDIAERLEALCGYMGEGIVRWLKVSTIREFHRNHC